VIRMWMLIVLACTFLCACPPKTKQLGEECYLDCGLAPLLGPALPNCISDCAGDMVCESSETKLVCRLPCDADSDCPSTCTCVQSSYQSEPGDMNPPVCKGDTVCGDETAKCDRFRQDCDQSGGARSCYTAGGSQPGKDACLQPGTIAAGGLCSADIQCISGAGCDPGVCTFYCSASLLCADGLVCVGGLCVTPCALWEECPRPHPLSNGYDCRPVTGGKAACVPRLSRRVDCTSSLYCDTQHVCVDGLCTQFCDAEHPSCSNGGACTIPGDGGVGWCPPPNAPGR
jgi:hypothetical protein